MPFRFLKYLQPTNYFRLKNKNNKTVFPKIDGLPKYEVNQLDVDKRYKSSIAQVYDLSWQAIQRGYIGDTETYQYFEPIPLYDEYCFISKNFNKFWVIYVLLLRLLSLKNPIKELNAFFNTRYIKRISFVDKEISYSSYDSFKSNLIKENPIISVVIPTLNRYIYLKDVLLDLEKQTYTNFEVIVVDQSNPYDSNFYNQFDLSLNLIYQEERALWLARNKAIKASKGELILLFDDDSRVDSNWIYEHIKTLDFFKSDLSSGVSISKIGAKVPDNYSFFRVSDQLDTGNVLIKKSVFREIGLFDRQYEKQRMGDGEFGLRSYLNGFLNISNPKAKRLHLKVGSGGLREMGSWDGFRPKKWFGPRPVPSVLYQFRTYYGRKNTILAILKTVPPSIIPYSFKGSKIGMVLGFLLSILILPLILFQVLRSWYLASVKLKEGAKIDVL
ncbi:MAG: glycosyltransferase family A protein [Flavobacteriaceae bacterium]